MLFVIFGGLGNHIIEIVILLSKCAQNPVRAWVVFLWFTHMNVLLLLGASGNEVYFPVLDKIFNDPAPALRIKLKLKVSRKSLVCLAPTCVTNIITHPSHTALGPSAQTLHLISDTVLLLLCLALWSPLPLFLPCASPGEFRLSGPVAKLSPSGNPSPPQCRGNYSLSSPDTHTIASSLVFHVLCPHQPGNCSKLSSPWFP